MRTPTFRLLCGCALMLTAQGAGADTVTLQQIPNASGANDMSPDGRYIVGQTMSFEAYLLDTVTGQMTILPPECINAMAVSDDGKVVLGDISLNPETMEDVAAIWTASSGVWTSLGYLPNALTCPSRSDGYELSADGSVAVGLSWDGCSGRGFRWTQATGMVELQPLANGGNRASVCSADGSIIGGFAQGTQERTPARWTANASGVLLDPPSGDARGEIYGINDSGTIMLGSWNNKAVKWTGPNLDRTQIGGGSILPGWTGIPMDVSNDGTVVGFDILGGNRRAWIQPHGAGPLLDLKSYVESNGGVVPEELTLEVCQAITSNGRTIIGHGMFTGAWIITITPSCPADIAPPGGNGAVNIDDLLMIINNWGGASSPADITGDGSVNIDDLLAVINAWGACQNIVGACCTGFACSQTTQDNCVASGGVYLGDGEPCTSTSCANNDACANAIDVTSYINLPAFDGDNSVATPAPYGGDDPELPPGSPSCQWIGEPDNAHSTVWYTFDAPDNGNVILELCLSNPDQFFDSTLGLYSGTCGSLIEIGCSEDGCADPPAAPYYSRLVAQGLTPGQKYYICVMNPGSWLGSTPGPFKLLITSSSSGPGGGGGGGGFGQ